MAAVALAVVSIQFIPLVISQNPPLQNSGSDARPNIVKDVHRNSQHYATQLKLVLDQLQDKYRDKIEENPSARQYILAVSLASQWDQAQQQYNLSAPQREDYNPMYFRKNMKYREFNSSKDCAPGMAEPDLKTAQKDRIEGNDTFHTELQLLNGIEGNLLLTYAATNKQVVLLYSYYVPCSQNWASHGECAGEMAHYIHSHQQEPSQRPYFIVLYDEVFPQTNECISQLYMQMGGIPSFKLDKVKNIYAYNVPNYQKHAGEPWFQPLPRYQKVKLASHLRMFVDCLYHGNFFRHVWRRYDDSKWDRLTAIPEEIRLFEKLVILWYVLRHRPESTENLMTSYILTDISGKYRDDDPVYKTVQYCHAYLQCHPEVREFPEHWPQTPPKPTEFLLEHSDNAYTALTDLVDFLNKRKLLQIIHKKVLGQKDAIGKMTQKLGEVRQYDDWSRFLYAIMLNTELIDSESEWLTIVPLQE